MKNNKRFCVALKLLSAVFINVVVDCNFLYLNVICLIFIGFIYCLKIKINNDILESAYLMLFFIWSVIETCLNL